MGVFQNNLMGAAAAAASAGGGDFYSHQIAHSIRNSASQDGTLKRTAGTPTSGTTFTFSYWVKRYDNATSSSDLNIFVCGTGGGSYAFWGFKNNTFTGEFTGGTYGDTRLITNAVYRDTSAWYHHVVRFDSTQATATNRVRLYVNGTEVSYSSQTVTGAISQDEVFPFLNASGVVQAFGGLSGKGHGTEGANLQMAEIVFNDGQSYGPDSYGETKNGVWIPKDPSGLTFGNNGYYLNFAASGDLGNDVSGNNNDFTVANIASHDQMLDSPTFNSDSNGGNFCTLNGTAKHSSVTLSEGNLRSNCSNPSIVANVESTYGFTSGKIYFEMTNFTGSNGSYPVMTVTDASLYNFSNTSYYGYGVNRGGDYIINASNTANVGSLNCSSTSDIRMFAIDFDNSKLWAGKNGTWYNTSGTSYTNSTGPESGNNYIVNGWNYDVAKLFTGHNDSSCGVNFNFGQDGTFAGNKTAQGNSDATGYGNFYYTVPDGFLAVCSGNQPVAAAVDPAQTDDDFPQKLFQALAYTGDGNTTRSLTLNFKPDWTWLKQRSHNYQHTLYDTTRTYATLKALSSDGNWAEGGGGDNSGNGYLSSSDSSGFSLNRGTNTSAGTSLTNSSSTTYASWNWRANGGTTSTNTSGSVNSTVQADPSGAFSIVTWAGSGGAATIGHGLSGAPSFMAAKSRTSGATVMDFIIFHKNMNNGAYPANESRMYWNSTGGYSTGALWQNDNNSASVFGVTSNISNSSKNYVAYCFTDVEGYCKAHYYKGNGSGTDGPFIYTGFRPAFILVKRVDSSGAWYIQDNTRDPFNPAYHVLKPNNSNAEEAYTDGTDYNDFLSNGFKVARGGDAANFNTSGATYIYLAMAKNPFKYATAR